MTRQADFHKPCHKFVPSMIAQSVHVHWHFRFLKGEFSTERQETGATAFAMAPV
jgi:hypothetical protein